MTKCVCVCGLFCVHVSVCVKAHQSCNEGAFSLPRRLSVPRFISNNSFGSRYTLRQRKHE